MRRPKHMQKDPFMFGLLTLLAIMALVYLGFTKQIPFTGGGFELQAAFKSVNDLKPKSPVRIAGVNVGKVKRIEPIGEGEPGAIVTMQIEEKGLPIHRDAVLKVRPRIFLEGNYFVELQPGSPSAPTVEDGERIPVQQTSRPVQIGEVLTALQSDTREDLQVILDEYGRALANGGAEGYNASVRWWPGAFKGSAIVNDATLGENEGDLGDYIRDSATVAAGLDRNRGQLKNLITDFATTADALADADVELRTAIGVLDDVLIIGRTALAGLNSSFPAVRRLAAELIPAQKSSLPQLKATLPFLRQLRGLVSQAELGGLTRKELRDLVPELVHLNRGGVGVQEQLRLLSSCQAGVLVPWANDKIEDPNFPATGKIHQEGVKWLPGIAGESRSFDANGQYVKTLAQTANYAYPLNDGRFFLTTLPLNGVNPPKADAVPPLRPDVDCETQERPDMRSRPGVLPAAIKVDHTSPAVQARLAKARGEAVKWLRGEIESTGLKLKVRDQPLTAAELKR